MPAAFPHYLSAGALFRDCAEYVQEWIEFHLLVGVERFSLYDNKSADNFQEVLAPYVESGVVEIIDWPHPFPKWNQRAIDDCVARRREDSRWVVWLDVDEFLFSPTGRPVPEVLERFERWPGVAVNLRAFGTSGHVEKPPGLVIENYTRRAPDRAPISMSVKTIVDPRRALKAETPHHFSYAEGTAVDENERTVEGWRSDSHSSELLRSNHYITRSLSELRRKHEQWATADPPEKARPWEELERITSRFNAVVDEDITIYVPRLKAAMGLPERDP